MFDPCLRHVWSVVNIFKSSQRRTTLPGMAEGALWDLHHIYSHPFFFVLRSAIHFISIAIFNPFYFFCDWQSLFFLLRFAICNLFKFYCDF